MRAPWRSLALAAALNVVVACGIATAQTVVVVNAPPGSTVELLLNRAKAASGTADAQGTVALALREAKRGDRTEMTARVFVDTCGPLRQVHVFAVSEEPPAAVTGCSRREFSELFALRATTSLVVDVTPKQESVWVKQGKAPSSWTRPVAAAEAGTPLSEQRYTPKGGVIFGGAGFVKYRDWGTLACGQSAACTGSSYRPAFSAGAAYWILRFLAAETSYIQPADVEITGSGSTYRFISSLDTHIVTFSGKGGAALGRLRLFGQAGANYSWTMSTTTQTIADYTYTVDNVTTTLAGGTETFQLRTGGWGWLVGGGVEFWVSNRLGLYGEFTYAQIKGSDINHGEGGIDDRLAVVIGGVRFHLGR